MSGSESRVPCPQCKAANEQSSTSCWQCGQPLSAQQDQPTAESTPSQPPVTGEQIPTARPLSSPQSPTPPPSASGKDSNIFIILGFVFAAIGFMPCCGWPLAIAGIVMGIIAATRGNKLGVWVVVASVVSFVPTIWAFVSGFNQALRGGPFPGGSGPFGPHGLPTPHPVLPPGPSTHT